ncbi:hypothetical protein [Shewanella sp.]|uniref:hypothetical protein n=1 Tax=Shewanella sp. TaxID=50422 RepID=UPI003563A227
MLSRQVVVWLFTLTVLLGIPAMERADFAHGPVLLDSSHAVSLLPVSEPSLNSLRPPQGDEELPVQAVPMPLAQYSVFPLVFADTRDIALHSLCRHFPTGCSPPLTV